MISQVSLDLIFSFMFFLKMKFVGNVLFNYHLTHIHMSRLDRIHHQFGDVYKSEGINIQEMIEDYNT